LPIGCPADVPTRQPANELVAVSGDMKHTTAHCNPIRCSCQYRSRSSTWANEVSTNVDKAEQQSSGALRSRFVAWWVRLPRIGFDPCGHGRDLGLLDRGGRQALEEFQAPASRGRMPLWFTPHPGSASAFYCAGSHYPGTSVRVSVCISGPITLPHSSSSSVIVRGRGASARSRPCRSAAPGRPDCCYRADHAGAEARWARPQRPPPS